MREQLIQLVCQITAGSVIMVIHELPKSIIYICSPSGRHSRRRKRIFLLHHYIDPIGLLFCVTAFSGFSKPYMFRIKERTTNFKLGITGFATLTVLFCVNIMLLKENYPQNAVALQAMSEGEQILKAFQYYLTHMSLGMLIVNLFPISTFDMGLLIAGKSPSKYFAVIQGDFLVKTILILSILMGVIQVISGMLISQIMTAAVFG